jgi:hypothetical protein
MRAPRLALGVLLALIVALTAAPTVAQDASADPEVVTGEECVTYPETGPIDLQYCVKRHFTYVSRDGELLVTHEYIVTTYTVLNGQPVSCVQAEHIVIANGAIRHEKGRFTCP